MADFLSSFGASTHRGAPGARSNGFTLPSLGDIFDERVLNPQVTRHLTQVYGLLFLAVLFAAFGSYIAAEGWIPASPLMSLAALIGSLYILWTKPGLNGSKREYTRSFALMASALCTGAGLTSLLAYALYLDPSIPALALAGTSLVFLGLTVLSLSAKSRSMLFLGGLLSSGLSVLGLAGLIQIFYPTTLGYLLQLYGGLAVFSLYVCMDTQVILNRCIAAPNQVDRNGRPLYDVPQNALTLWLDLVPIFTRILVILIRQREQRGRDERQKRRRAAF